MIKFKNIKTLNIFTLFLRFSLTEKILICCSPSLRLYTKDDIRNFDYRTNQISNMNQPVLISCLSDISAKKNPNFFTQLLIIIKGKPLSWLNLRGHHGLSNPVRFIFLLNHINFR